MIIISKESKFITESVLSNQIKDDIMDSVKKLIKLRDVNVDSKYMLLYSKELGVGFCLLYHYVDLNLLKEHTEDNKKIISSINKEATTIMLIALDQSNFQTKWNIKSNNVDAIEEQQLLSDINKSIPANNLFVWGDFIMLNSRELYKYFNIVPSPKTLFNPDQYIAEVMAYCTNFVFEVYNNKLQPKQNNIYNIYKVNYTPNMFDMDNIGVINGSIFEQMLDELDITPQKYIMTLTNKLVCNEELLVLSKDKSKALLLVVPLTQNGVDYNSILLNELEGYMVAWEQYELAGKLKNLK